MGDGYLVCRAMTRIFEQRLHELGHDLHAALAGARNDHLQDVFVFHPGVGRAKVSDERVVVELGSRRQIRPAGDVGGLGDAVVGPAVELPRDAPADLEPEPAHGSDKENVDPDTLPERVEHRRPRLRR